MALGQPPLLGVLAGSVTLTGGPATGLAFAPLFEEAGVQGAATLAVAAAMVGIVSGGIVGGPVGTWLITRLRSEPASPRNPVMQRTPVAANVVEAQMAEPDPRAPEGEDVEAYGLLKALVLILAAMWAGSWLTTWFASMRTDPSGLHRRDARRRRAEKRRRWRAGDRHLAAERSTTSDRRRCRSSSSWR